MPRLQTLLSHGLGKPEVSFRPGSEPHYYRANLASAIRRLELDPRVSMENKTLILDYNTECIAQGFRDSTLRSNLDFLSRLARVLGRPFQALDRHDILLLVKDLQQSGLAEATKDKYKGILKRFYTWMGHSELVEWIRIGRNSRRKLPEELLTRGEVETLIGVALMVRNYQDAAFIAVLYESGCRIGEMLSLELKHVSFDEHGAILRVPDRPGCKTGARRVRIIESVPHLRAWLQRHPCRGIPGPLWVRNTRKGNGPMRYHKAQTLIARLVRRAGIRKRVYCHLFRHSRATELAQHLTEAQMKVFFGWSGDSRMPMIYVHLSGRDLDPVLIKLAENRKELSVLEDPGLGQDG